jgi:hypothetical protein
MYASVSQMYAKDPPNANARKKGVGGKELHALHTDSALRIILEQKALMTRQYTNANHH